jgi:ribokinase
MIRIVVLGDVNLDIHAQRFELPNPGDESREAILVEPGGAAATFARTAARLGAFTTLIGAVGDDWIGGVLARSLEEAGVHTVLRRATVPSGAVLAFHDDRDRSMICSRGANDALDANWVRENQFDGCHHLHVSGYTLLSSTQRTAADMAFSIAKEHQMSLSIDPPPASLIQRFGLDRFLKLLPDSIWIFPNRSEGRLLSRQDTPFEIVEHLRARFPTGALTLGEDGAIAWTPTDRDEQTLGKPVSGDTTGAGDVYAASFVTRFLQTEDLHDANAFACDQAREMLISRIKSRG